MSDHEVLAYLFNDAQGKLWTRKDNWLSSVRYGKWYGVMADAGGHVLGINLADNGLQGHIHDSSLLILLVGLKQLILSSNSLPINSIFSFSCVASTGV
jgi:hypothetical protein